MLFAVTLPRLKLLKLSQHKKYKNMKLQTTLLAIILLSGCAAAPPRPADVARGDYASTQAYVSKLIQYEMDQNQVAGLSIALVDDVMTTGATMSDAARALKKQGATTIDAWAIARASR